MRRILLSLSLFFSLHVLGFDLAALSAQLQQQPVVQGQFQQTRYLHNLPQALHSSGVFTLVQKQGLYWELQSPFALRLRLDARGIAQQDAQGQWQISPQSGQSRQIALFMALLGGDTEELSRDFELQLSGTAQDWQLMLKPKSAVLQQIFQHIQLQGDQFLRQVEILETQGDRSLIRFSDIQNAELNPAAATALAP